MVQKPVVMDYRHEWEAEAATEITRLFEVLGQAPVRIEHIGSTAIPTMPAKNVIDLQVSVPDLFVAAEALDGPLQGLGYQRSPYQSDHVPAGGEDEPTEWAKRLWIRRGGFVPEVNLHVRKMGSPNERLALLFRDWFRAHPEAIPAYGRFKQVLAASLDNVDDYSDVKDPVVDLIVIVAEPWALATGWQA